jgi:hypothetical protein
VRPYAIGTGNPDGVIEKIIRHREALGRDIAAVIPNERRVAAAVHDDERRRHCFVPLRCSAGSF